MTPKILRMHEIETNGTVKIDPELAKRVALINIIPKLKSSGVSIKRYNIEALKDFAQYDNIIWKFVIADRWDIKEIAENYEVALNLNPMQIYLMSEGTTAKKQIEIMSIIMGLCKQRGWNYSPRLQVLAYNDERKR